MYDQAIEYPVFLDVKARNAHTQQTYTLEEFVECVTSDAHKPLIEQIRNQPDKDIRRKLKQKLPAIRFANSSLRRQSSPQLRSMTGVICLDIDSLSVDRLAKLRPLINELPFTLASFVSPSGAGLRILLYIEISRVDEWEKHAKSAIQLFEILLFHEVDPVSSRVDQVCYLSHDPDCYINLDADPFPSSGIYTQLNTYFSKHRDLPLTSKDDEIIWSACGIKLLKLSSVVNTDLLREFFDVWSSTSKKYDPEEIRRRWPSWLSTAANDVIDPNDDKHNIKLDVDVLNLLEEKEGWKYRYLPEFDRTQKWYALSFQNDPCWNNVSEKESTDISNAVAKLFPKSERFRKARSLEVLQSAENIFPFDDYMKTLPLSENTIEEDRQFIYDTLYPIIVGDRELKPYEKPIIDWFLYNLLPSIYTRTRGGFCDWAPILYGTQGDGKNTFISSLLPEDLRADYIRIAEETLIAKPREQFHQLQYMRIVHYDERAGMNKVTISQLKTFLSSQDVAYRDHAKSRSRSFQRTDFSFFSCNDDASSNSPLHFGDEKSRRLLIVHFTPTADVGEERVAKYLDLHRDNLWRAAINIAKNGSFLPKIPKPLYWYLRRNNRDFIRGYVNEREINTLPLAIEDNKEFITETELMEHMADSSELRTPEQEKWLEQNLIAYGFEYDNTGDEPIWFRYIDNPNI